MISSRQSGVVDVDSQQSKSIPPLPRPFSFLPVRRSSSAIQCKVDHFRPQIQQQPSVRLRKWCDGETSKSAHQQQQHRHLTDPSSERIRSRTDGGWSNCSFAGQDLGSFPLTSKSRSDHSLHRILKEDNTWTVFATLRPPSGNCHYGVA